MWSGLWWLSVAFPRIVHVDDNRGQVGQALVVLSAAVSTAREVGPWQASDAQVAELIVALEVAARALAGVQLAAIAEGITRGLPFSTGAGTGAAAPGRWVRSLIPVNPGEAARRAASPGVTAISDRTHRPGAARPVPAPAACGRPRVMPSAIAASCTPASRRANTSVSMISEATCLSLARHGPAPARASRAVRTASSASPT